jgi:hypothetical protein
MSTPAISHSRSTPEKVRETIYLLSPLIGGGVSIFYVVIVASILAFVKSMFTWISDMEWIAALIIVYGFNISNKLDDFFDPQARKYRAKYR